MMVMYQEKSHQLGSFWSYSWMPSYTCSRSWGSLEEDGFCMGFAVGLKG